MYLACLQATLGVLEQMEHPCEYTREMQKHDPWRLGC